MTGGAEFPLPYILKIPNQRNQHTTILNNIGSARSMRAPRHPQACFLTMCAMDDLADKLGKDPLELVIEEPEVGRSAGDVYQGRIRHGAQLMDWKAKWQPKEQGWRGADSAGLGLSFHTWTGTAHPAACSLTINPDGSVVDRFGDAGHRDRNPNRHGHRSG